MSKKILLNTKTNEFVQYKKYDNSVSVKVEIMYLLKLLSTHSDTKLASASSNLYNLFSKNMSNYHYGFIGEDKSAIDYTFLNKDVEVKNYDFVSNYDNSKYGDNEKLFKSIDLFDYLHKTLLSNLVSSNGYLNLGDVKIAYKTSMKDMTDNTAYLVNKKFSNKRLQKVVQELEIVGKYIEKNNFEQFRYLKVYCVDEGKKNKLIGLTCFKNSVLIENFNVFFAEVKKHVDIILAKEFDFSDYNENTWDGNLSDESSIENKKSFYIIAQDYQKKTGFIGLSKVYNPKNSSSYTFSIVKDIKNALLFTDDHIYDIGYFTVLDKLYLASEVLKIDEPKSELGKTINIYLEKKSLSSSLASKGDSEVVISSNQNKRLNKI